ncbi:MAG: glycosyltransferase family A protein [Betaproteobacteria bacterium]
MILATIGADERLGRLMASLRSQTFQDFEVIIVDQSGDDRLVPLVDAYRRDLRITHVRHPRGLSRSRNAGIAVATGTTIGFPDDDCWYDVDLLARVRRAFSAPAALDGITGRAVFDKDEHPPARFARRARWVAPSKVWTQGISCTIFLTRALVARVGPFDESLGLGAETPWTAAEESDYLLRAVAQRARIWYDPGLTVHHPGHRGAFTAVQQARGRAYARAMGHVMRRHHAGYPLLAYHLARPACGAVLTAARGRFDVSKFHLGVLAGRWRGWRDADAAPLAGPSARDVGESTAVAREVA